MLFKLDGDSHPVFRWDMNDQSGQPRGHHRIRIQHWYACPDKTSKMNVKPKVERRSRWNMRDEDLELFIEELGEPTQHRALTPEELEAYQGILPDKLLEYWQDVGWSGFSDGLFWLVNPADYDHLVDMWLEDTPFPKIDHYRVIARNAFGKLYLWGEQTNQTFTLNCPMHAVIAVEQKIRKVAKDPESAVQTFFAMSDRKRYNIKDTHNKPLFVQALSKLGPLKENEVYGFEPALIAGGDLKVDNLAKLDLDIHLTILRQMSPPKIPFSELNVTTD